MTESEQKTEATLLSPVAEEKTRQDVQLHEVPVYVQKILVDGVSRTKSDILRLVVNEIFSARNFEEMIKYAHAAKLHMEMLGLFKSVGIHVDISRGVGARNDGYNVTYQVQEPRRLTGGISTLVGTNEGSLLLSVRMPNAAGRGERISADFTYGSKNAVGWSINANKHISGCHNKNVQLGIFQNSVEFPWSAYKELDRGAACDFSFPALRGINTLRMEGVWRELSCLSRVAAFSVREHCGPSLKSALKYTWLRDTRDSRVLPSTGLLYKLSTEVAGVSGNANYWKSEAELQLNKKTFLDSVVQFSAAAGVMNTLKSNSSLNIMDRFYLGGPLTLRGFNIRGVGPHEDGCALVLTCTGQQRCTYTHRYHFVLVTVVLAISSELISLSMPAACLLSV